MHPRRLAGLAGGAGAVFALLALDVVFHGPLTGIDQDVSRAVTPIRAGWPTSLAEALASAGSWVVQAGVLVACSAAIALVRRRLEPVLLAAGGLLLLGVLGFGSKDLIGRSGPGQVLAPGAWAGAFPSGHTATAVVVGFLLVELLVRTWPGLGRPAWAAATLWSIAVGWSRVQLDVHWLTDVLAGLALGAFVVCLVLLIDTGLARRARPAQRTNPPTVDQTGCPRH